MEGDEERGRARERVFAIVQDAFTRAEVEEAEAALLAHLATGAEDEALDLARDLEVRAACLREREEQSRLLQFSPAEHEEREQMLRDSQVAADGTQEGDFLARIEAAQHHVQCWLDRHPDDLAAASRLSGLKASKALAKEMREVLRQMEPSDTEPHRCGS